MSRKIVIEKMSNSFDTDYAANMFAFFEALSRELSRRI